jgi:hypothetical protein
VRAAGNRPRAVGGHYNSFLALEAADPACAKFSAYFDGCRMKRNQCEYDFAGGGLKGVRRVRRNYPSKFVSKNLTLVALGALEYLL